MFSNRKDTADKSDSHTENESDRKQNPEYGRYRHECPKVRQYAELRHNVADDSVVYNVQQPQRNRCSDKTDQDTFNDKRCPYKTRNGALTNKFVAPISFMIPISSFRTEIPIVTVLLIRKTDTARRIRMIAMET